MFLMISICCLFSLTIFCDISDLILTLRDLLSTFSSAFKNLSSACLCFYNNMRFFICIYYFCFSLTKSSLLRVREFADDDVRFDLLETCELMLREVCDVLDNELRLLGTGDCLPKSIECNLGLLPKSIERILWLLVLLDWRLREDALDLT